VLVGVGGVGQRPHEEIGIAERVPEPGVESGQIGLSHRRAAGSTGAYSR
jgi:hypothetical protein